VFSIFSKKRKEKDRVLELHGMAIKYVTERRADNDDVVGRGGSISIRDGVLIIFASSEIVFRCPVDQVTASQLLSGDGVVIEGADAEHGGVFRKLIAYYVYHRK